MILTNLKSFLKHLLKNKLYSLITIFGFSISLMFILLLSIYIKNEYSADQFHVKKDKIFRLTHGEECGFAPPSGELLMQNLPELESFVRTCGGKEFLSSAGTPKLKARLLYTDSTFFKMFSFKLIKGDPEKVLKRKSTVVLSQSFAYKLFGKIPEIGSTIKLANEHEFELTGIMADFPDETHFEKVDALISFPTLALVWGSQALLEQYNNNSFGLYILAKPNCNIQSKENEILKLFKEVNWMFTKGFATYVKAEPLTDLYFSTSKSYMTKHKSKRFVQVLSGIVLMILVLSIINYVNLTIAQSSFRSKEIAIRKLVGAKKLGLLLQSLTESILLSFFSLVIAIILSFQVEPVFNYLLDTRLNLISELTMGNIFLATLIMCLIGIVSGLIPALKISRYDPIEVVKGKFKLKEKNIYSKIMISFQYLIIITLIICALFISKQTLYMRNYQLGFNQDNIVCFDNNIPKVKQRVFGEILSKIAGVNDVCLTRGTPLDGGNNLSFTYDDRQLSFQHFYVDTNFFKLLNIPVKKTGVAYSSKVCWLNEAAIEALEFQKLPLSFKMKDNEWPVYGVVKNFHFRDLKDQLGPALFHIMKPNQYAGSYVVKLEGKNSYQAIQEIERVHRDFTDGIPLELEFFDESVRKWYEHEEKVGEIVAYFALLTAIISVMGLFAMSLYYVQQKQKEIGVRKVNGAKTREMLVMLNIDFIKWVVIAFFLACPIAWYAMSKWLENFAYKTELSWWIFALAGLISMGIALLTVSFQSYRAATRNPVESLRYE